MAEIRTYVAKTIGERAWALLSEVMHDESQPMALRVQAAVELNRSDDVHKTLERLDPALGEIADALSRHGEMES